MGVKRDRESAGLAEGPSSETITEDEAALYDRQIRLWGMDCQKRLREAKLLVIGLNGLGVDYVKNLALSGVKSITLMDETPVSETDSSSQFFAVGHDGEGRASASLELIRNLNPNVEVTVDPSPIESLPASFFAGFTAVFATAQPVKELVRISKACHEHNVKFCCGQTWGFYGYGFFDFQSYKYSRVYKDAKGEQKTDLDLSCQYNPLEESLNVAAGKGIQKRICHVYPLFNIVNAFEEQHGRLPSPSSREEDLVHLKSLRATVLQDMGLEDAKKKECTSVFGELSPVCSVLGGIMANEMIKGISGQGIPIHNFVLFDGEESWAVTAHIRKKE
ncbi:hypothetical protein JTE90_020441 [Oedothorax gibbosus]|uniref:THIF-type NAD/FAD binding fold domain-containing protein n=1 Tax=Oedothorax gibbosus TaxID=931172 RepID=A0AAV6TZX7_9ARAC|nr:hypothetical protein JTE90_020441 [Oedothorax gibbosus]